MYKVLKRDGSTVEFDITKISNAIRKSFIGSKKDFTQDVIDLLALRVTSDFQDKIKDEVIDVEDIQDSAEKVLSEAGYSDVSKAYILYRKQRENVRNIDATTLDYKSLVDSYLNSSDWRIKENSTVTYSIGGLILSNSGAITANYWLSEAYDEEIAQAHRNGDIHIHDLSMLSGYSAGWSIGQLIKEGLDGGMITSGPARHLSTLCNQMVNFLGIMQNEWAGAQSFSSFDTYLAPFIKVDQLSYKEVKQCIQTFVYGVNTPSRWGSQAPFTTITLDWTVPEDLKHVVAIVGGEKQNFTYSDCKEEMDMINKAFIEVMMEGDYKGRAFQYPIPTYSITDDFVFDDSENNKLLFEMTAKYGMPYFANYKNSEMKIDDIRHFTKKTKFNSKSLLRKCGGYFGSGEMTGSIGVVTMNLPRIAYLSKDEKDFYQRLDSLMDISARSLKTKRTILTKLLNGGLYPYTKRYLSSFEKYFSTIGLVGMNEAGLNAKWLKKDLTHKETQAFATAVLDHMKDKLLQYQEMYGDYFSLEATPAESSAYRLAKHDKEKYPDIITANKEGTPYYTNSTHLPVGYTDDIFDALDIQDAFETKYTSGTTFHVFLGERLNDYKNALTLVKKIAENYRLPYYTISPTYSICEKDGYIEGEAFICPKCGKETEVYSRITGYYRPLKNWNAGKLQEYKERKTFEVEGGFKPKKKTKKNLKRNNIPTYNVNYLLFITKSNDDSKTIMKKMEDNHIPYILVDVDNNPNLVKDYEVNAIPSLAVASDHDTKTYSGFDEVMQYLNQ